MPRTRWSQPYHTPGHAYVHPNVGRNVLCRHLGLHHRWSHRELGRKCRHGPLGPQGCRTRKCSRDGTRRCSDGCVGRADPIDHRTVRIEPTRSVSLSDGLSMAQSADRRRCWPWTLRWSHLPLGASSSQETGRSRYVPSHAPACAHTTVLQASSPNSPSSSVS